MCCVQYEWFFSSWDEDVYVPVDEETDEATPISSMNREMLAKAESLGMCVHCISHMLVKLSNLLYVLILLHCWRIFGSPFFLKLDHRHDTIPESWRRMGRQEPCGFRGKPMKMGVYFVDSYADGDGFRVVAAGIKKNHEETGWGRRKICPDSAVCTTAVSLLFEVLFHLP